MSKEKPFAERAYESGWSNLPPAGIIPEPGNSKTYETGDWRSMRPIWHADRCIQCLSCWIFCPENAIVVKDRKVTGINLLHCKGCGICAVECPDKVTAIDMVDEGDVRE